MTELPEILQPVANLPSQPIQRRARSFITYRKWKGEVDKSLTTFKLNLREELAASSGDVITPTARELINRFIHSERTKLHSLRRSYLRGKGLDSGLDQRGRETAFEERWRQLRGTSPLFLNVEKPCNEIPHKFFIRMSRGRRREMYSFGQVQTARQLIVHYVLKILNENRSWNQRLFSGGGRSQCIQDIKEALSTGRYTHYAAIDIENFFPSIRVERIFDWFPFKESVFRNTLALTIPSRVGSEVGASAGVCSQASISQVVLPSSPLVLPQGAVTSPIIAYGILERGLHLAPSPCAFFSYADNFLILGHSEEEVVTRVSQVEHSLDRHPAGRMQLGQKDIGPISAGVEFLGVRFDVREGDANTQVQVSVSDRQSGKFERKLTERVAADLAGGRCHLPGARHYIDRYIQSQAIDDRYLIDNIIWEVAERHELDFLAFGLGEFTAI